MCIKGSKREGLITIILLSYPFSPGRRGRGMRQREFVIGLKNTFFNDQQF
jgi:hypothetical protein